MLAYCNWPLLKDISLKYKVFDGFRWLTSNQIFGSVDFWDISPLWFLNIFESHHRFTRAIIKIFKNTLGQFFTNGPPKRMVTSTNFLTEDNFIVRYLINCPLLGRISWVEFEITLCDMCANAKVLSPYFLLFGLNTGNYRPEKISCLGTFHTVVRRNILVVVGIL